MYRYNVSRIMLKKPNGIEYKAGVRISDYARGYVFAADASDAVRKIEALHPSNEYDKYDVKVTRTDIITM